MKKVYLLLTIFLLLNGCAESVALLGGSVGGASSGRALQSTLTSTLSYGVKHKTGKTPLGHVIEYAEKINPEKKKDTCISFIERTRSEFCTIAKKQISLTNIALKKKVFKVDQLQPKTNKIKDEILEKEDNLKNVYLTRKSPRKLAITFQSEMRKKKNSYGPNLIN